MFTATALSSLVALSADPAGAVAAMGVHDLPASKSVPDVPGVRHRRIRLADGVELHVAEAGAADGVPIVLLHGFTDSWFSWSRVLERLPSGVRAIVPTHRGHGDSERPPCCYRMADFAADVVALLDALQVERAHLIGHSMGGRIAQRVAIDHPERVDRLVLVSSAETSNNPAVAEFGEVVRRLEDPIDPAFIRDFQSSSSATELPSAFLDEVVRESAKLPARVWRETMAGLIAEDLAHDVVRIQAPTLIVWGDQDGFFPRAGQETLARQISHARLLVYAGVGHSPSWETPERLLADMTAFLGIGQGAPDARLSLDASR